MQGLRVIMNGDDIRLALQRMALQILEKNQSARKIAIVGIHTWGVFVAERLIDMIQAASSIKLLSGTLDISLYRDDWTPVSPMPVVNAADITFPIEEIDLVLVDDVIYTGRTIRSAMNALIDHGRPRTIQLACLLDRGGRQLPLQPDYTGLLATVRTAEQIQVQLMEHGGEDRVTIETR